MVNLNFYKKKLSVESSAQVVEQFQTTLVKTNRNHKFFVDWKKIKENAEKMRVELNLLNSLIGTHDFDTEFRKLVRNYPEVIRTFPILVAVRDLKFPVIEDFTEPTIDVIKYNFDIKKGVVLEDERIDLYLRFVKKTGLIQLFYLIKNFYDYIVGVEVGLDTNARKNRSGKAMENLVEPLLNEICQQYDVKLFSQKTFGYVSKQLGIQIPEGLRNRKFDFLLVKNGTITNIEVNYYAGSGSKPEEIVDSYINRHRELRETNNYFIWITDGDAWNTSTNQITKAFETIDYVLNIYFVKRGLLEEAIKEIYTL